MGRILPPGLQKLNDGICQNVFSWKMGWQRITHLFNHSEIYLHGDGLK